jgi:hypothetical protein
LNKSKNISLFLAFMLIAGTIAAFTPSFIIGVNAQSEPYYRDNSYGSEQEYPPEYADSNSYNSYEPEYRMDNYKKLYSNDNYEQPEYPSYQPDYKSKYPSYGKDDRDKSKDSSNSVSLNKIKCINNNVNINGNNAGNVSLGNKGVTAAAEGYSGAYSSGENGYGSEGYYNDGYNNKKQDKGFECIINNNNNNTNQTIPPGPTTTTLNVAKAVRCVDENVNSLVPSIQQAGAIEDCEELEAIITPSDFTITVTGNAPTPNSFEGSEAGTEVQIGVGPYTVTETLGTEVTQVLAENPISRITTFTGQCTQADSSLSALGTIEANTPETCNIINTFTILPN